MLWFSLALQTHHGIKVQITNSNMYKKPCMPPQCNRVSMWGHRQGWALPKSAIVVENVGAPSCSCPPNGITLYGKNSDSAAQRQCLSLWIVNHFSKNPIVGLVRGIWGQGWNWQAMLVLRHQLFPPFPSNGFCASVYKMPVPVWPWQVLLGQKIVSPVAITPWNFFTLFAEVRFPKWNYIFQLNCKFEAFHPFTYPFNLSSLMLEGKNLQQKGKADKS